MFAAAVAPAFVRAQSLMPARQLAPSSTAAIVERALAAPFVEGEFGFVTLYSLTGEVLAKMTVNENPTLGPVNLHTTDFKLGRAGKAFYSHPLLGTHEFVHSVYGVEISKEATAISVTQMKIDITV